MAKVFVSCSHKDEDWKDRIVRQLGVLSAAGLEVWDDRRIAGGDDWLPEITTAIEACDVAVLLISAHFLTSKFIVEQEVPALLQRREKEGLRVMPVILSPCQWARVGWLKAIQARPKDGSPLSGMTTHDAETALSNLAGEIHDLVARHGEPVAAGKPLPPEAIDLTHLPDGAEHFFGRTAELAELDAAWASAGDSAIVQLIAHGGVGKTSLVKRWLEGMRNDGWRGAQRVYGWSFYSQGTRDDKQASEDHFLAEALAWFGVDINPAANPWDKASALARAVIANRTLLVLDGIEPLQYPPGPLAGELHAPGLKTLLQHLATAGHAGLCLITSRVRLEDLNQYERNDSRPDGIVQRLDLQNLDNADGARLLHKLGANRAGASAIADTDAELCTASREVDGHALTLSLLGRYLALAYGGDIRQRDQVNFQEADAETTGGHAFKVIAAYEIWFASTGKHGESVLATLRLFGFFDRPAGIKSLRVLRAAPAIPGLTRPLVTLDLKGWRIALNRLEECGLIFPVKNGDAYDAHPLVREYLAASLKGRSPDAWRKGHRRLYEQLKASAPHRPDGLAGLQPLYQAIAHGCLAGLWQKAVEEVYIDRIARGVEHDGFYSIRKLGAFGADLGAVACFFVEPWQRPAPALTEAAQPWLLNQAAHCLRALGRLEEALEPMLAGAAMLVEQKDWGNAASSYSSLSELQLSLGRVAAAVDDAEMAVNYADRSGDAYQRLARRADMANALQQQGASTAAQASFTESEAIQAQIQPEYPLLYSIPSFNYCELLLARAERAAWSGTGDAALVRRCNEVAERAAQTLKWATDNDVALLDIALGHLTLARSAIYAAQLQNHPPGADAEAETELAVTGLHAAGQLDDLPRGLLTRAWLRHCLVDLPGAQVDLAEAQQIAARGGMKLHLADIALTRARLFHDRAALAEARRLIEECGYGRRLPELADAEAAALTWPEPTPSPERIAA